MTELKAGDVVTLEDGRGVILTPICYRGRWGVRNTATGRFAYIKESRLKRLPGRTQRKGARRHD
jgi:hypothetical protein